MLRTKIALSLLAALSVVHADSLGALPREAQIASAAGLTRADLESWLDGLLPHALQQGDVAGAVIAVVKEGTVLLEKGYGHADVSERTPMDPRRTLVRVASISKLFAWTAVMQQVERGRLDLDRGVEAYLDFALPDGFGQPITLRHLLTHTAGFEEHLRDTFFAGSLREYLQTAPDRINPPGEVFAYSNYGASLAGYIVERVSGEPFEDYVKTHIFDPLGMQRSTFRQPREARFQPDIAPTYRVASDGRALRAPPTGGAPAGALATTAHDMARFMLAHLHDGRYGDFQLLSPDTARAMHAHADVFGPRHTHGGFFEFDRNGHRIIGHGGGLPGAHSRLLLFMDDGVGLFVSLNSDGASGASDRILQSLFEQFADRYFPGSPLPVEPTLPSAAHHARLAEGEYLSSRRASGDFLEMLYSFGLRAPIEANADGTILTPSSISLQTRRPKLWHEIAPFVWREVGGRSVLRMQVEDGAVTAYSIQAEGALFQRVPAWRSGAVNLPVLIGSASVLALTSLMWPLAALVRRHYGRRLQLPSRDLNAYRLTRVAALVSLGFLIGWVVVLQRLFSDSGLGLGLTSSLDPWIRLIQVVGLVCVAGAAVAVWNAWLTWRRGRNWRERVWSVVLALALLDVVWCAFVYRLLSVHLNY